VIDRGNQAANERVSCQVEGSSRGSSSVARGGSRLKGCRASLAVLTLLVVAFGLLGWRLFRLQFSQAQQARQRSYRQIHAQVPVMPHRGRIWDRRGRVLADSRQRFVLFADRNGFADPEAVKDAAWRLQEILNVPGNELCAAIHAGRNPGYIKLREGLTVDQRTEILHARLPGIGIQTDWQRVYPSGRLACHVVGYVGYVKDRRQGCAGVELQYDPILRGTAGKEVFVVDARRRPIGMALDDCVEVEPGRSLILTIDATIQQYLREALAAAIQRHRAESAVGVVMDPWTGQILALVSLPDFDPLQYSRAAGDPAQPMKNRVLSDPYEPGSIFKPIAAAVGIDCGAIAPDEVFYCENGYFAEYRIGEFLNHPYGRLSVKEILAKSSNVGMAKIGLKIGPKRLYEGVRLFGFGQKTGIDLPGEDAGVVWPTRVWDKYTVTRIPFGHAISVTAIQIARAYCIIANGGRPVVPHVVKAVVEADGRVRDVQPTGALVGQVIRPETAEWVRETALVEVVNEGTGKRAQLPGVQSFGKTGTANIARPRQQGGGYDQQNYISSFVGGAPAGKPELVVLVSLRKPDRSNGQPYSGGRVAAPVFREVMEQALRYLREGRPRVEPAAESPAGDDEGQEAEPPLANDVPPTVKGPVQSAGRRPT